MNVGISSCLLGNTVRYDGQHKLNRFLRDELGRYVQWYPVCPEVECGLPVPREAMRLVGSDPDSPRLMTVRSNRDITARMEHWVAGRLDKLAKEKLRGFVFKSKSPSSGMRGVKIYTENGMPGRTGSGIFAREFMKRFPHIPVEDEGRLHDPGIREHFIERLFAFDRWSTYREEDGTAAGLIAFHAAHKYLLMSHSPAGLREAGKLTAGVTKKTVHTILPEYETLFLKALSLSATVTKQVNVLHHIMGYFRTLLLPDEKQEIREIIEQYRNGFVPLVVPIVLLQHYTRKYAEPYLSQQWYLHPHPGELKLRNHA